MSIDTEFDLIRHYFNQQRFQRQDVVLGIGDDAAILSVPADHQLVVTTDTSLAGVHFLEIADPHAIAYKSLASNLSDLAAMGATPTWCSLALTLPSIDEQWLARFCDGLFSLANQYDLQLIGGDTTKGPLSITFTLHGVVPTGKALRRDGASVGDYIYVTGHLGDSAAGLTHILSNTSEYSPEATSLIAAHYYPTPRIEAGILLRDLASAALDISDGLIADLGHILKASQLGARIDVHDLPISECLLKTAENQEAAKVLALTSGEEYELCFTLPPEKKAKTEATLMHSAIPFSCIGRLTDEKGIVLMNKSKVLNWELSGWDHFKESKHD